MKDPEPRPYTLTKTLSILTTTGLGLFAAPVFAQTEATSAVASTTMNQDILLLIVFVLSALAVSFLCSIAEAVLLSITPTYIAGLEGVSPKKAVLIKRLKGENIDRSLAAILTLNTIAHTMGAIGAGAKANAVFGSAWFGLFSAIMTLLILFLSEILPKTLGAVYWRSLTTPTAVVVNLMIKALYPLIVVSEKITRMVTKGRDVHVFNRDEFIAMAHIGKEAGHINDRESRIIRNLFHFGSLRAQDIMTPRTVVAALPQTMPIEHALQYRMTVPFSRIPVFDEDLDSVSGFVLREDLLIAQTRGTGHRPISELRRDIVAVAATTSLSNLLELFLDKRQHVAIVVGEYGETQGLVTMEDVIETLLGIEIVDEGDKIEDMQQLARKLWRKRAESLGIKNNVQESRAHASTESESSQNRKRSKRLVLADMQS
ncbi:hemolysin [Orrella marina]|uniref:Hemolysin n=2 Tax=Orrella marina TaxID=2163011 RepID=A0A2R4XJD0_9BURK|nr:hemolysin [Orrella marina]